MSLGVHSLSREEYFTMPAKQKFNVIYQEFKMDQFSLDSKIC